MSLLGDLTLKEGVKIHVASKFKKTDAGVVSLGVAHSGLGCSGLLAPPPTTLFTRLAPPPSASAAVSVTPNAEVDDDDFGDFEG